ncbi:unnamed protein product [Urochloa humidicola]
METNRQHLFKPEDAMPLRECMAYYMLTHPLNEKYHRWSLSVKMQLFFYIGKDKDILMNGKQQTYVLYLPRCMNFIIL